MINNRVKKLKTVAICTSKIRNILLMNYPPMTPKRLWTFKLFVTFVARNFLIIIFWVLVRHVISISSDRRKFDSANFADNLVFFLLMFRFNMTFEVVTSSSGVRTELAAESFRPQLFVLLVHVTP